MRTSYFIFALLFSVSTISYARTVTLRPGDQITIDEDDAVVVKCEKGNGSGKGSTKDRCHTFHSASTCQGLELGTVCVKDDKKKGECVSTGQFDGAPNCECK